MAVKMRYRRGMNAGEHDSPLIAYEANAPEGGEVMDRTTFSALCDSCQVYKA
jgi:hypothetical protein